MSAAGSGRARAAACPAPAWMRCTSLAPGRAHCRGKRALHRVGGPGVPRERRPRARNRSRRRGRGGRRRRASGWSTRVRGSARASAQAGAISASGQRNSAVPICTALAPRAQRRSDAAAIADAAGSDSASASRASSANRPIEKSNGAASTAVSTARGTRARGPRARDREPPAEDRRALTGVATEVAAFGRGGLLLATALTGYGFGNRGAFGKISIAIAAISASDCG